MNLNSAQVTQATQASLGTDLKLGTVYPFSTDLAELKKLPNTFEFTQGVRGKPKEGEAQNVGVRVVMLRPTFLRPSQALIGTGAKIYIWGAEELYKEALRKWVKDNAVQGDEVTQVPKIELEEIETLLASTGAKLITKDSLEALFEDVLAECVVGYCAEIGKESDAEIMKYLEAYKAFFLKLASPAQKYEEGIATKLIALLERVEAKTPIVVALIARLTKKEPTMDALSEFL